MKDEKEKPLDRSEVYLRILKILKLKPAAKSPVALAYFTTDHLRALYSYICEVTKCRLRKTR